jgi:hypothetical protein
MLGQNSGWFQGSNEGSKGEGLSRFLGGQLLAQNNALGIGIDASYALADLWLNSTRQDFVNNAPDDNGYDATNGCTTLFIYYLFSQLGYSIDQFVGAGASTLAGVYKNLTGNAADPFPLFKAILDLSFPSTTSSAVPGPNFDDPWPLAEDAFTGVWRSGTDAYYLWVNADESHFISKWSALASQNLRRVTNVNGRTATTCGWTLTRPTSKLSGLSSPTRICGWSASATKAARGPALGAAGRTATISGGTPTSRTSWPSGASSRART